MIVRYCRYGLAGAAVLALTTVIQLLFAAPRLLFMEGMSCAELLWGLLKAVGLASALGLGCGAIIGLLAPLARRAGLRRSVAIGALGAPTIMFLCILAIDPSVWQMANVPTGAVMIVIVASLGGMLGATLSAATVDEEIR